MAANYFLGYVKYNQFNTIKDMNFTTERALRIMYGLILKRFIFRFNYHMKISGN